MSVVGGVLQGLLDQRSMSQSELATRLEKSPGYVHHIISGRKRTVDDATSAALSRVLGTEPSFWSDLHKAEMDGTARRVSEYLAQFEFTGTSVLTPGVLVDYQIEALALAARDAHDERDWDDAPDIPPSGLHIDPFDLNRLQPTSYDTSVGGEWVLDEGGGTVPREVSQGALVASGTSAHLYTREHIGMPENVHARISPAHSLLANGLLIAHGPLVDPLFSGHLTVVAHNYTNHDIFVPADEPFLTLVFEALAVVPERKQLTRPDDAPPIAAPDRAGVRAEIDRLKAEIARLEAQVAND